MASVTGTYTITVAAATAALAITPSTGTETETEGTAVPSVTVVATVSGGVPPYTYAITGLPTGTGLSFNEVPSADGVVTDSDIQLAGTPNAADAAASPISVSIVVTDSAGATTQLKKRL